MARNYSQVTCAIWRDPDFRNLSMDGQWVYLMLITQAEISSVGSLPITWKRWAGYAQGLDTERLSTAIRELEERHYIVVDHDLEELLIRSFVRWDCGYKIPKRLESIKASASRLNSTLLQQVAAYEMDQLGIDHGLQVEAIDSHSIAIREDIESPVVVVTKVGTTPLPTTHKPFSTTHTPAAPAKGSRLDPNWQPSPRLVEFVQTECPAVNGRTETANFIDYWIGKSGRDATKVDWDATYRKWMRNAQERAGTRPPTGAAGPASTTDAKVASTLALGARLAEREAAQARKEISA